MVLRRADPRLRAAGRLAVSAPGDRRGPNRGGAVEDGCRARGRCGGQRTLQRHHPHRPDRHCRRGRYLDENPAGPEYAAGSAPTVLLQA